jgi:hypothetical protein
MLEIRTTPTAKVSSGLANEIGVAAVPRGNSKEQTQAARSEMR